MGVLREVERQAVKEERWAANINRVIDAGICVLRSCYPTVGKEDDYYNSRIMDQAGHDSALVLRSANGFRAAAKRSVDKFANKWDKKGGSPTSTASSDDQYKPASSRGGGRGDWQFVVSNNAALCCGGVVRNNQRTPCPCRDARRGSRRGLLSGRESGSYVLPRG